MSVAKSAKSVHSQAGATSAIVKAHFETTRAAGGNSDKNEFFPKKIARWLHKRDLAAFTV